ncbi:MAG TPA: glycosyltransferase family 4 protein [Mycobacteriales bacterium]|nr:glycosyltransferase family 4 protein [Mycobacteriales bacterium]
MRVLHVTDTYLPRRGGIELHVHDLARAQRAAGHEVDVLTLTRAGDALPADSAGLLLRPANDAGLLAKARFTRDQRRRGADAGYDVVHAHCSTVSPLVFASAAVAEVPTVVTVHSLWRRYTALYRAADATVGWSRWPVQWSAVSAAAADAVRRAAVRSLDVQVISNGVDVSAWPRQPHHAAPGRLRVASVMRLAPRKRPIALLRMIREVAAAVPAHTDFSAVIIGDGPEAEPMRRYLRRHRLEHLVTLTGHLPRVEIARRLASADVYLAPATLESFGIAALEAAVAGLPVLGRAGTGLAEFVGAGKGGLLVDSDAAMVRTLVELAHGTAALDPVHPETLVEMSWPAVVERTHALYVRAGLAADRVTAAVASQAS